MGHPIRIRIKFPPATADDAAKALGITPAERKAAEALVRKVLATPRRPRRRRSGATGASIKTA